MNDNYKPIEPKDLIRQGVTLMAEIIRPIKELKIHKWHWVATEAYLLFEVRVYGNQTIDFEICDVYIDSTDIIKDDALKILRAKLIDYLKSMYFRYTDMGNQVDRAVKNLGYVLPLRAARR